eukprot:202170-Ditylum_brightwellii.AAC.1
MSKRLLVIYLPWIEVDVTEDSNLGDEWITGTMFDAVGNMQLLACPYRNLPKAKGSEIKKIPITDSVLTLPGDDLMHVVSLPLSIPVPYAHRLQLGKVTNEDIRFSVEAYHHLMGLWSDMLAY